MEYVVGGVRVVSNFGQFVDNCIRATNLYGKQFEWIGGYLCEECFDDGAFTVEFIEDLYLWAQWISLKTLAVLCKRHRPSWTLFYCRAQYLRNALNNNFVDRQN